MKHVCRFTKYDETKGHLKFREDRHADVPQVFGNMYVKKWALPVGTQNIIITIEVPEDVVTVDLPSAEDHAPIIGSSYPAE